MKENANKEGLGSRAINGDSIQREEAEDIIRKYAASDDMEDLAFSSDLGFEERKEIAIVAKKFGLTTRRHHCRHCGRLLYSKCSAKEMPIIKYNLSKQVKLIIGLR